MNDRATRWQVRVIAVMVLLMWWAFLAPRLEDHFQSLPENRRALPPALLHERPNGEDLHNPFTHARHSGSPSVLVSRSL
jgi:hypothetical protein